MTLLGISNLDDTPSSDYSLSDLASKIVDECWPIMLRGTNEVLQADEKPEEECICICDNGNSLVVVCKDCSKSISDREDITFLWTFCSKFYTIIKGMFAAYISFAY